MQNFRRVRAYPFFLQVNEGMLETNRLDLTFVVFFAYISIRVLSIAISLEYLSR